MHLSFVRSITMDSWTDKQIKLMENGGNDQVISFFQQRGIAKSVPIQQKYKTAEAELYRERIKAVVEGREPPTELPAGARALSASGLGQGPATSSGGGQGVSALEPLPGETQDQYVARQRQLNDEARHRMQAKFGPGGLQGGGGGRMQGFGSDPDYDPSRGRFGGGKGQELGSEIIGAVGKWGSTVQAQLQEGQLGKKLQASWSTVQSRVQDPELASKVKERASSGWSALATGAATLWSKTADLTVDLVRDITKEEDEPIRFYNRLGEGEERGTGAAVRAEGRSGAGNVGGRRNMGRFQQDLRNGSSEEETSMLDRGADAPYLGSYEREGSGSSRLQAPLHAATQPQTSGARKGDGWDDDDEDFLGAAAHDQNGSWQEASRRAPTATASMSISGLRNTPPPRPLPSGGSAPVSSSSSSSVVAAASGDDALDLDVDAFVSNVRISDTSAKPTQGTKAALAKDEDFFSTFGV